MKVKFLLAKQRWLSVMRTILCAGILLIPLSIRANSEKIAETPFNALRFDGVDDYVTASSGISSNLYYRSFTLEAWAKRSSIGTEQCILASPYNYWETNCFQMGFTSDNKFKFSIWYDEIKTTQAYTDTLWHHWVAVHDNDEETNRIYCDGTLVAEGSTSNNLWWNNTFYIGQTGAYISKYFHGSIDEVKIWNTLRTASEINADMNAKATGSESGLLAYYDFDQTSGATLPELTTNQYIGTLNNMRGDEWTSDRQPSENLSFSKIGFDQFSVSWTGESQRYLVFATNATAGSPTISTNVTYTADDTIGKGTKTENGWYCVYNGANNQTTIKGLLPTTTYRIAVVSSALGTVLASETENNPANQTTLLGQWFTFDALPEVTYGDADIQLTASSATGILRFESDNTDVATILDGNILHIVGGGSCHITASYSGDETVGFAEISRLFVVNRKAQTITFDPITSATYGQNRSLGTIHISSELQPSIDIDNWNIVYKNNLDNNDYEILLNNAGSTSVQVYQEGNANYLPANTIVKTITIAPTEVTIAANPAERGVGKPDPDFTYTAYGLVYGEGTWDFSKEPKFTTAATLDSKAGTYPIVPIGAASQNYKFKYVNSILTVIDAEPTLSISKVERDSFTLTVYSKISSTGGKAITEQGLCWSQTSETPDFKDNVIKLSSANTEFSNLVEGLDKTKEYYVRAYAINSIDTAYSESIEILAASPTVKLNNALDFEENTYVSFEKAQNIPIENSTYTIEAWIKPNSMGTYGIVGWGNWGSTNQVNALRLTDNGISHYWWGNDATVTTDDLSNKWHHVAVSYDGTTRVVYLDGNAINTDQPSGHNVPTASNIQIGTTNDHEYFNGAIDEVRIWNIARSAYEIRTNKNIEFSEIPAGLVAYYKFNQGIANGENSTETTLTDAVGNSNGTLNNFSLTGSTSNWVTNSRKSIVAPVPAITALKTNFNNSTARISAYIADNGGQVIKDKGICWSTSANPEIGASNTNTLSYSANSDSILGNISLSQSDIFYVRAYAKNLSGIGYSEAVRIQLPLALPGNAVALDGSDDYIESGSSVNLYEKSFTFECWAKRAAISGNTEYLFGYGGEQNYFCNEGAHIGFDYNNHLSFNSAYNCYGLSSQQTCVDTLWHHWAVVNNTSTGIIQIYKDGVLDSYTYLNFSFYDTGSGTNKIYVGKGFDNVNNNFHGSLDEVRVWEKALTAEQIKANMFKSISNTDTTLVLNYSFNEGLACEDNSSLTISNNSKSKTDGVFKNFDLSGTTSNVIQSAACQNLSITVSNISKTGFDLSCGSLTLTSAVKYTVSISQNSNFNESTLIDMGTAASITIDGLNEANTYYVRVIASSNTKPVQGIGSNVITLTTQSDQTIWFNQSSLGYNYVTSNLASASSGLAMSYSSSNPSVIAVENDTIISYPVSYYYSKDDSYNDADTSIVVNGRVKAVGKGVATITATQAGNNVYYAASATAIITVNKGNNEVTNSIPDYVSTYTKDFDPHFRSLSSSTITFESLNTDVATIVNGKIHVVAPGLAAIQYTVAEDDNFNETIETYYFEVSSIIRQYLSFVNMPSNVTYGNDFDVVVKQAAKDSVYLKSSNNSIITIIGNRAHIIGTGSAKIIAQTLGNDSTESSKIYQWIYVNSKTDEILDSVVNLTFGGEPFLLSKSKLGMTVYSEDVQNSDIAYISNQYVYPTGIGTTYVWLYSNGNNSINWVNRKVTINVFKAKQTIDFPTIPEKTYSDADFSISAEASTDYALRYVSTNLNVATISDKNEVQIVGLGSSTIIAIQDGDTYFAADTVSQKLTVNPANLTINVGDATAVYGEKLPKFSYAINEADLKKGETISEVTGTASFNVDSKPEVGTHKITLSGLESSSGNYNLKIVEGQLTITKAALSIVADAKTKVYGSENPALTFTYSGFVNGESVNDLDVAASITTNATKADNVGNYSIIVSGAQDRNYAITYIGASLSVTPAALNIAADTKTKVYGSENPVLTVTYSGFVNGESANDLDVAASITTNATKADNVGNYSIIVSGAQDRNYAITYTGASLSVTPAALNIAADAKTKVYGSENTVLTVTYSGFVNGESANDLDVAASITTNATKADNVGNYNIIVSGAQDRNYAITYTGASLSVTPAALNIAADAKTKVYGSENPALTVTYSGFVNGESANDLDVAASITTNATKADNVGKYNIIVSGAQDRNYAITYTGASLSVTPAVITVSVKDTSILGLTINGFEYSYSGFVNGDDSLVISGTPVITADLTNAKAGDTIRIVIDVTNLSAQNYTFVGDDGLLIILKQTANLAAKQTAISVYPNPIANGILTINVGSDAKEATVTVISLNGKVVLSSKITDSVYFLNVDNLITGTYVIRVTTDKQTATSQFIKL